MMFSFLSPFLSLVNEKWVFYNLSFEVLCMVSHFTVNFQLKCFCHNWCLWCWGWWSGALEWCGRFSWACLFAALQLAKWKQSIILQDFMSTADELVAFRSGVIHLVLILTFLVLQLLLMYIFEIKIPLQSTGNAEESFKYDRVETGQSNFE